VGITYDRARELCQQLGETTKLYQVLGHLSIFHYVRSEVHTARELGQQALRLAEDAQDPLHEALGHWHLGMVLFMLGDYAAAHAHLQHMISFYDPDQHHHAYVSLRGSDGGLAALAYSACCLWCLGYPDQAAAQSEQALTWARDLGHSWSLADVVCYAGCMFHAIRRAPHPLLDAAKELGQVAQSGIPGWASDSDRYRGDALVLLGQFGEAIALMREAIATSRAKGVTLYLSGTLGFLAEAQAKAGRPEEGLSTLGEALGIVEETDERHGEAELHRLRAEILLMMGDEAQAEASLTKALEVARGQNAKSWELRAATSLARLWAGQGKQQEARHLLADIYGWFTEGFDTPDLMEARNLLQSLS
jgi:adenylate cyclase